MLCFTEESVTTKASTSWEPGNALWTHPACIYRNLELTCTDTSLLGATAMQEHLKSRKEM